MTTNQRLAAMDRLGRVKDETAQILYDYVPSGIKTRVDEDAARRAAFADPEALG